MLVRFCVDYRIKPHIPPLVQIPANSVKFLSCDNTLQVGYFVLTIIDLHLKIPIFYSIDY